MGAQIGNFLRISDLGAVFVRFPTKAKHLATRRLCAPHKNDSYGPRPIVAVLQCVAVCCSVLQCVAVVASGLFVWAAADRGSVLQFVALAASGLKPHRRRAPAATESGANGLAERESKMPFGLYMCRASWRQSRALQLQVLQKTLSGFLCGHVFPMAKKIFIYNIFILTGVS